MFFGVEISYQYTSKTSPSTPETDDGLWCHFPHKAAVFACLVMISLTFYGLRFTILHPYFFTPYMPNLYMQLQPDLVLEDLGTAGLLQTEQEILDALPVEAEDGVVVNFDTEQQIACVSGLSEETHRKLMESAVYDCGGAIGEVRIISNPYATDTASVSFQLNS